MTPTDRPKTILTELPVARHDIQPASWSASIDGSPTRQIPQLVNIDTVCSLLALKRSAVYNLVANGLLDPPCKLSPGRRGASRFLLSSVLDFIQRLAAQRTLPPTTMQATSAVDYLVHPLTKTAAKPNKTRQVQSLQSSAGGTP